MRKLTVEQKKQRGTFDPSKIRQPLTFEPLDAIPAPMTKLGAIEMQYFNHCAEILVSNRTMSSAELSGLTRASELYGIFVKAKKEIDLSGSWTVTKNGFMQKSAAWQVLVEAEKYLTAWEKTAGMSILSRSKLPPPPEKKEINSFETI